MARAWASARASATGVSQVVAASSALAYSSRNWEIFGWVTRPSQVVIAHSKFLAEHLVSTADVDVVTSRDERVAAGCTGRELRPLR